jgi:hypothetical protein
VTIKLCERVVLKKRSHCVLCNPENIPKERMKKGSHAVITTIPGLVVKKFCLCLPCADKLLEAMAEELDKESQDS